MTTQVINALEVLGSWMHLGPLFILVIIGAFYAVSE